MENEFLSFPMPGLGLPKCTVVKNPPANGDARDLG